MSTDRTPYQRLTDRRRARATRLIEEVRSALGHIEKGLAENVVVPDPGGLTSAVRLTETLVELQALEELAEYQGLIPDFQTRIAESVRQRQEDGAAHRAQVKEDGGE